MSNIKDDTINAPRLTITTKGNGCPGCGFPKLACRCGGASGDAQTNSEDENLESEDSVTLMLSIKLERQSIADLTPQLEMKRLLSVQNIFAQFKQELKNQKIDVNEYAAAIIDNELQVKIDDPDHRDAFIQRLNNNPLAAQNESANKENDGAKANNRFSIPNPYALPKCTPS